jgi:hypothetical protein
MIPPIADIIAGLISGQYSKEQASAWIARHLEMATERGNDQRASTVCEASEAERLSPKGDSAAKRSDKQSSEQFEAHPLRYTQNGSGMIETFRMENGQRVPAGDWIKAGDYEARSRELASERDLRKRMEVDASNYSPERLKAAVLSEREACAALCEYPEPECCNRPGSECCGSPEPRPKNYDECAAAIRARSKG